MLSPVCMMIAVNMLPVGDMKGFAGFHPGAGSAAMDMTNGGLYAALMNKAATTSRRFRADVH